MDRELLEKIYELLGVAFSYDGDVFGVHHNDAVDVLSAIEVELAKPD